MSSLDRAAAAAEAGARSTGRDATGRPSATRVDVLGCPVDALSMKETVARCLELIEGDGGRQVSVNVSKLAQLRADQSVAEFVTSSDVISADGKPVVWLARVLGTPLPERVSGIDLMRELLVEAERRELRVFVLGASQAVLDEALARISARHADLAIAGHHGYFANEESSSVTDVIRNAHADILFVAMPSPAKELWLDRNLDQLGVPFAMGIGGTIDVVAGKRARAPVWAQRAGLEWAFRLAQEPRRMWRRYLQAVFELSRLMFRALYLRAFRRAR